MKHPFMVNKDSLTDSQTTGSPTNELRARSADHEVTSGLCLVQPDVE